MRWKFDCNCPLCEEEAENCQDEKYEKFESLKQEAETLFEQSNNQFQFGVENMRREVQLYKEMYKLAKEKQASGMFMLINIQILIILGSENVLVDRKPGLSLNTTRLLFVVLV